MRYIYILNIYIYLKIIFYKFEIIRIKDIFFEL